MVRQKVLYARLQKAAEIAQTVSVEEEVEEEHDEEKEEQEYVFHNQHALEANNKEGNLTCIPLILHWEIDAKMYTL